MISAISWEFTLRHVHKLHNGLEGVEIEEWRFSISLGFETR